MWTYSGVLALLVKKPMTLCNINGRSAGMGRGTLTTESSTNGAVVSYEFIWTPRTCHYTQLNAYYYMLFSSMVRVRVRVRIRFMVFVWLVVIHTYVHAYCFSLSLYRTRRNEPRLSCHAPEKMT